MQPKVLWHISETIPAAAFLVIWGGEREVLKGNQLCSHAAVDG